MEFFPDHNRVRSAIAIWKIHLPKYEKKGRTGGPLDCTATGASVLPDGLTQRAGTTRLKRRKRRKPTNGATIAARGSLSGPTRSCEPTILQRVDLVRKPHQTGPGSIRAKWAMSFCASVGDKISLTIACHEDQWRYPCHVPKARRTRFS
eukprot:6036368-Amphidinium_carterae.1